MISFDVGFVLLLRDGFTGRPMTRSAVRCTLDGMQYLPEFREGGYFVFVNIAPGVHEVTMTSHGFQREMLQITSPGGMEPVPVALRPAADYPFGRAVPRLRCTIPAKKGARTVWIAVCDTVGEIKLAQDKAAAGDTALKLFYRGGRESEARRFPGNYLLLDGKSGEIVLLKGAKDAEATLGAPLKASYARGAAMYPAQAFTADENGVINAFYKETCDIRVFEPERGSVTALTLKAGENTLELKG